MMSKWSGGSRGGWQRLLDAADALDQVPRVLRDAQTDLQHAQARGEAGDLKKHGENGCSTAWARLVVFSVF